MIKKFTIIIYFKVFKARQPKERSPQRHAKRVDSPVIKVRQSDITSAVSEDFTQRIDRVDGRQQVSICVNLHKITVLETMHRICLTKALSLKRALEMFNIFSHPCTIG
jgi:hypothetical protein